MLLVEMYTIKVHDGGGSLVRALIYELQGVKEIKRWWRLNGYTGRVIFRLVKQCY